MEKLARSVSTSLSQIASLRPLQSGTDRQQHPRLPGDVLAHLGSSWKRVSPALLDAMASVSPATVEDAEASSTSLPWYVRYTRWKPTSRGEAVAAERNLLGLCSSQLDIRDVVVGEGRQEFMHTISAGPANAPPMVLLPGYGAGAGFYFRNIDSLAQHFRMHAVDLLGTGMSGRPNFPARTREEAEGFFVGALAKWREAMGMEKMILVGHSLGGYLAASYALQHPEHVQHLVLVGPAGVPQDDVESRPQPQVNRWSMRGQLYHLSHTLWEAGATPGTLIRGLGPWGPSMIQKYARNRFREGMGLSDKEVAAFEEYFYHIMAARGSGEHALRHLLAPFARAKHPLEGRLQHIKVPVTFIYGDADWMEPAAGQRVARAVLQHRGRLSPTDGQVNLVERAGHYAFLDQPQEFLQKLLSQTLTAFPDWEARLQRRPDETTG